MATSSSIYLPQSRAQQRSLRVRQPRTLNPIDPALSAQLQRRGILYPQQTLDNPAFGITQMKNVANRSIPFTASSPTSNLTPSSGSRTFDFSQDAILGGEIERKRILAGGGTPATAGASAPPLPVTPPPPAGELGLPNYTTETLPPNSAVAPNGDVYERGSNKLIGKVDLTKSNPFGAYLSPEEKAKQDAAALATQPTPENTALNNLLANKGVTKVGDNYVLTGGNGEQINVGTDPYAAIKAAEARDAETNIVANEAKRRALFESQTQADLAKATAEEQQYAEGQKKTLGAGSVVGRAGSMGFSSAEQGIIQGVEESSRRRIADLNKEAKDAIRNFDYQGLERIKNEIATERQNARERENTLFSRFTQKETQDLAKKTQAATEANQARDNAQNTFNSLATQIANGVIDPTKLDVKQLAEIEKASGAPTGSLSEALKKAVKPKDTIIGSHFSDKGGYIITQDEKGNLVTNQLWKAPSSGTGTGDEIKLSANERSSFNSIASAYEKSPLPVANDQMVVLKSSAKALEKDLKNSASQIQFIYSFIKALDLYQSAVRTDEVRLIGDTQGVAEKIANLPQKIMSGSVMNPSTAKRYIKVAETLANVVQEAAELKKKQFAARAVANGANVEKAWSKYTSGFGVTEPETSGGGEDILRSPDGTQEVNISDLTPAELEEAKAAGWL